MKAFEPLTAIITLSPVPPQRHDKGGVGLALQVTKQANNLAISEVVVNVWNTTFSFNLNYHISGVHFGTFTQSSLQCVNFRIGPLVSESATRRAEPNALSTVSGTDYPRAVVIQLEQSGSSDVLQSTIHGKTRVRRTSGYAARRARRVGSDRLGYSSA